MWREVYTLYSCKDFRSHDSTQKQELSVSQTLLRYLEQRNVGLKTAVFWDVAPYTLIDGYQTTR